VESNVNLVKVLGAGLDCIEYEKASFEEYVFKTIIYLKCFFNI